MQRNSFHITATPDDGRLWPKHFVKGRGDGNSCIVDGIILCAMDCLFFAHHGL
jgi:hypothetical protein